MLPASWIGRSLSGRYQIESLLGQGGMSAVYKATDPNLKRVVAIKLIHPHLSGEPQFIQRFEEEATAVASLRHPNIVQVYDFNSDQGVYYMVLEFVPGETLHDRLQRLAGQGRTFAIEAALRVTLKICEALAYAHQRGIIHRDIKPANLMLNIDGQPILMDFGIVKLLGGASHTVTGAVLGTARYISPEVIRSEPADQRSDLYSLGITLYEMLSGKTPFQSDSAMTLMMMHLNDPVPDPRTLRADIPPALVQLLLKALEKDRSKRFQSAAEMAAALQQVLAMLENGTAFAQAPASTVIASSAVGQAPQLNQPTWYEAPSTGAVTPARTSPPSTQFPAPPASRAGKKNHLALWLLGLGGGCLFFVLLAVFGGLFFVSRSAGRVLAPAPATETSPAAPASLPTQVPEVTPTPLAETATPPPSATPAPTLEPTATFPPLYVQIKSITLSGNQYVVDYETFGYTEKLPGMHIHFFFNTVSQSQAGAPGSGPWILYGGPNPFRGYSVSQRPANATQICALVANRNHSIIAESGNCLDLP
jgi:serine/threonine protein kinase